MNIRTLSLFLGLAGLSGCVSSNRPYYGDVQFTWSFSGQTCSNQVSSVQIIIPGEPLQNNGIYPCLVANYPGIVLHDFVPGTYNFTIYGLDSSGITLFSSAGTFTVNGSIQVFVDLQWAVGGVAVSWRLFDSFGPQNCSSAGIDFVYVNFQDLSGNNLYPRSGDRQLCIDGFSPASIAYNYLPLGTYRLYLQGSGFRGLYSDLAAPPTVTIVGGQFPSQPVTVWMAGP